MNYAEKQMALVAGGNLCTDPSCVLVMPILGLRSLAHSQLCPVISLLGLLQHGFHRVAFEDHLEIVTGPECGNA